MAHNPAFLKLVDDARSRIQEIDIAAYQQMVAGRQPHILVDTREDSEWAAGHVAGAVHLGKGIIERDIETKVPDKAARIILYCGGGFRSVLTADMAKKMGYQNAASLIGGYKGLVAANWPMKPDGSEDPVTLPRNSSSSQIRSYSSSTSVGDHIQNAKRRNTSVVEFCRA